MVSILKFAAGTAVILIISFALAGGASEVLRSSQGELGVDETALLLAAGIGLAWFYSRRAAKGE